MVWETLGGGREILGGGWEILGGGWEIVGAGRQAWCAFAFEQIPIEQRLHSLSDRSVCSKTMSKRQNGGLGEERGGSDLLKRRVVWKGKSDFDSDTTQH